MSLRQELFQIADEIRGVASYLNYFAKNIHSREHAHHLMELAGRLAGLASDKPLEAVREGFVDGSWQHFSPVIAVEAVVLNPQGEMLLIQRSDSQRWALPGGVAEIGPTFSEAVLRELWEEAGLRGQIKRLLGVFDGRLWQTDSAWQLVYLIYQIECREFRATPGVETIGAGFFGRDTLPTQLHPGHEVRITKCFELLNDETYFDPADSFQSDLPMLQRPTQDSK
ncbi:MAG: NUDIX domain-containing protein [Anaerolineaceae bacterium]|nr:NUDIX domain-containing protein [Anaerolineaceae bacterium]